MIRPGLVSITFRSLAAQEIIALVARAGLDAIEWGGDIHVPHGDVATARTLREIMVDSGLTVSAYGSYYRVGHPESASRKRENGTDEPVSFEEIVETAVELGAPKIRVWAGIYASDKADESYFEQVVRDSEHIANLASAAAIEIAYEYHGNTLTDTDGAAKRLLETVNREPRNSKPLLSYWQPRKFGNVESDLAEINTIKPWLSDIHVFSWHEETGARLALADKSDDWQAYFHQLHQESGDRFALLEFVQDDNPANFMRDAATLKELLKTINYGNPI